MKNSNIGFKIIQKTKFNKNKKLTCQILTEIFLGKTLYYYSGDKYGDQFITWEASGNGFDVLLCGEYLIKRCKFVADLKEIFNVFGIERKLLNE